MKLLFPWLVGGWSINIHRKEYLLCCGLVCRLVSTNSPQYSLVSSSTFFSSLAILFGFLQVSIWSSLLTFDSFLVYSLYPFSGVYMIIFMLSYRSAEILLCNALIYRGDWYFRRYSSCPSQYTLILIQFICLFM